MTNLLMISGDRSLAQGKQGAFYNTLQELHKHFDRIDIICPNAGVRRYDMQLFGNVYVHPSPWPLVLQWFWIRRKGAQLIRAHTPGVMTVHEYPFVFNGIGARWLHRVTGVPYVLEVHHIVGYPRASGIRERIGRWFAGRIIPYTARRAAAVRVVNAHQAPEWLRGIGIPTEKIAVVPSVYLDTDVFKPQDISKLYDLIFVGRLARNKGLKLFLDVVSRTGRSALVVGQGPLLAWARASAHRRKLKIHFSGFAKDAAEVAQSINRARLLVMLSDNEGGPRVVVEALACGVPVLATPVGIVPDVLPPEAIEEWNAKDLADKTNNILEDTALYEQLRQGGLAAAGRFEKSAAIAAYADSLKRFLALTG